MYNFKDIFNANFDADIDFLIGKARNEDLAGDGTGSPWHEIVINGLLMGPVSALFDHSDVVADNSDEKAGQSQWLSALKTLAKDMNWGDRFKGSFAKGFTYTSAEDAGRGQDGEYYKYIGSDPFPKSVTAGLDPVTFPSEYELSKVTDHNNGTKRNEVGAHDDIYTRTKTIADLLTEDIPAGVQVAISDRLNAICKISNVGGVGEVAQLNNGRYVVDINPVIRVETYGDIGQGDDDTEAFEKALERAKSKGGGKVTCEFYPNGITLSRTIYVPQNVELNMSFNEIKPVAISSGGTYTSSAVVIVGNPSVEPRAFNCKLKNAKVLYSSNNSNFPARPLSIINASNSMIEYCTSIKANDRCFSVDDGANNIVQYCYAEDPRFHCFATDDGAERAIFQFNRTHNSKGTVSGDSYCFDISAENNNNNPCIVRFNYSTEGQRFFKGQQQAALVYGNYIEKFDDASRTTMVVGYGQGIHIFNNVMVDCAAPWLIGSGADGPATEAYIHDNILINRTVPIQTLLVISQDVKNIVYKNNYHVHIANFTANTRLADFDRSLAEGFQFTNNEFYITGTTVNNTCFRVDNLNGANFSYNTIHTSHDVALLWVAGSDNDIESNRFKTQNAAIDSVRIIPAGNVITNNRTRGGRFRVDDQQGNFMSGNYAEVWNANTTPDGEPQQGSGTPVGSALPRNIGDEYLDTVGSVFYKADGLTNNDWVALN